MNFVSVSSSDLSQVGYNPQTHELTVIFHSGGVYTYSGVLPQEYSGLINAGSVGRYFHAYIKQHQFRHGY